VAASVAAAVAFGWINTGLLLSMKGANGDFGVFFLESAQAFLAGRDMYSSAAGAVSPNLNPPHMHLLLLPLSHLSRVAAFACWMSVGVVCLVAAARAILVATNSRLQPWTLWLTLVALVSAPATTAVIATGQVSWLLMLPLTLAWSAARRGRWTQAGILIGIVASVKLFLLVLLPYLIVVRRWKAACAAVVSMGLCFAGGVLVFGVENHRAWIRALQSVSWTFLPLNASIFGALTRSLSVTSPVAAGARHFAPLVEAPSLIQPLWITSSVLIVLGTAAALRAASTRDIDRSFALLLVAALLISPLGWIYYLWLAAGPLAAMLLSWRQTRDRRYWLGLVSLAGFFWPIPLTMWRQPDGVLTVLLGCVYLWALLAIWIALLLDRTMDRSAPAVVLDNHTGSEAAHA
jgi:hypothetical protein